MKLKLTVILTTVVVAMGLLLGTSAAQEPTVIFEEGTSKAIGIENLEVDGTFYNVEFTSPKTAAEVYGEFPGRFDFNVISTVQSARDLVNSELNSANATSVGAVGSEAVPSYNIGYESGDVGINGTEAVFCLRSYLWDSDLGPVWLASSDYTQPYNVELDVWAKFTEASDTDSDNDGLPDDLENTTCTDPNDADTDDDGISDGTEDLNLDGIVDSGETDPCNIDSDGDGIQDGTELGYVLDDIGSDTNTSVFQPDLDPTTTTDPLNSDTDGDGFTDGREDSDLNGRVDEGETDPNDPNSYPVTSFSSAAALAVLANLYFDASIANAVNALDDPSYYPVVALNASKSLKYAEDAYDDATAALAAAGQDYTFWGYYAPIYAESDINVRADAVDSIILAAQYAAQGDLETAEYYLGYGISLAATADLYNGSTIWCASMEASGQAAAQQSSAGSEVKALANGSSSFTNAANYAVLANMNFATSVSYAVTAFDDPSYLGLVQLYAQTAYDYAVNEYNEASAALAAAGQDSTFWGTYAVQYAESDMNNKADALSAADQAVAAYQANDLETAMEYLASEFLSAALADVYNASTILCASIESAGATK